MVVYARREDVPIGSIILQRILLSTGVAYSLSLAQASPASTFTGWATAPLVEVYRTRTTAAVYETRNPCNVLDLDLATRWVAHVGHPYGEAYPVLNANELADIRTMARTISNGLQHVGSSEFGLQHAVNDASLCQLTRLIRAIYLAEYASSLNSRETEITAHVVAARTARNHCIDATRAVTRAIETFNNQRTPSLQSVVGELPPVPALPSLPTTAGMATREEVAVGGMRLGIPSLPEEFAMQIQSVPIRMTHTARAHGEPIPNPNDPNAVRPGEET